MRAEKTCADLADIVGAAHVKTGSDMGVHLIDPKRQHHGAARAVVFPSCTDQVQRVVSLALHEGFSLVPQGGNTGLVGGSIAPRDDHVVINLSRMNRIRDLDPSGNSVIAEAGVVLANLQSAALEVGRLFPLSLGSEGSCQVGGVVSTNAGGIAVLRYGMTRDLTMGLEAVLPDGTLWNGLNTLRKNNTGYDFKQLLIGGEGTLGIVTAAALRLFPLPARRETALVALETIPDAISLHNFAQQACGGIISAFEYMSGDAMALTLGNLTRLRNPLTRLYPHYVMLELDIPAAFPEEVHPLQGILERALEDGLLIDGAVAGSEAARHQFWSLREGMVEAVWMEGGTVSNDVSVPIARMAEFIDRATAAVATIDLEARVIVYGHLGDGNLHFSVVKPRNADAAAFLARSERIVTEVADTAVGLGGSFSAEHGIGRQKVHLSERFGARTPEMAMRRALKSAIDPAGIMNAGVMFRGDPR